MAMHISPSRDRAQFALLEDKFCKNFSCCGLELQDLHDLLQHFEECHVKMDDDDDDDQEDDMSEDEDIPMGGTRRRATRHDDLPFELETGIDSMDVDDISIGLIQSTRPQNITTIVTPAATLRSAASSSSTPTKSDSSEEPFTTTLSNLTEVILKAHIQVPCFLYCGFLLHSELTRHSNPLIAKSTAANTSSASSKYH